MESSVTVRIDHDVKMCLEDLAREKRLSLSDFIRGVIEREIFYVESVDDDESGPCTAVPPQTKHGFECTACERHCWLTVEGRDLPRFCALSSEPVAWMVDERWREQQVGKRW